MEDIKLQVAVLFYSSEKGGRKFNIFEGYRSSVLFGVPMDMRNVTGNMPLHHIDNTLNSSGRFSSFTDPIELERELHCELSFTTPNPRLHSFFKVGEGFIVFEGNRIVGKGIIKKVSG